MAEGNPYFLVEILRNLIEQGQLVLAGGEWQLAGSTRTVQDLRLPSTVRRLLAARIDTLEPAPRLVLQETSVVGQTFDGTTVEGISARPQAVQPSLGVLTEREFVHRVEEQRHLRAGSIPIGARRPMAAGALAGVGTSLHEYHHGLLRDAAYETLAHRRRQEYHGRLAELLEQHLDVGGDAGAVELLAYHYTESDRDEPAVRFALQAAENAAAQFANEGALFWYDRAAEALRRLERGRLSDLAAPTRAAARSPTDQAAAATARAWRGEQWVRLLQGRAAVEAVAGQFEAARRQLEEALARCEAVDSADSGVPTGGTEQARSLARRIPDICRQLARIHHDTGDYDAALKWIDRGLEGRARWDEASTGSHALSPDVSTTTRRKFGGDAGGVVAGSAGVPPASPPAPELLPRCTASDAARLCLVAGMVHMRRGHYEEAALWAGRAQALAEPADRARSGSIAAAQETAQAYNLLGLLARLRGQAKEAAAYCRESLRRYEAIGDVVGAEKAISGLADALVDQGDMGSALAHFHRAHELAKRVGNTVRQAAALLNMGQAYAAQGNLDQARQGYEAALEVLERLGHAEGTAICLMNLAGVHLGLGDAQTALTLASAAQEGFAAIGAANHDPEVLRYRALALLHLGRQEEALEASAGALRRARELKRQLEEGQALRVLGQTKMAGGDPAGADEAFAASQALLEAVNARYELGLTLLERARLLAATHSPTLSGRSLLARAAHIFREVGARRHPAAVEAMEMLCRNAPP